MIAHIFFSFFDQSNYFVESEYVEVWKCHLDETNHLKTSLWALRNSDSDHFTFF